MSPHIVTKHPVTRLCVALIGLTRARWLAATFILALCSTACEQAQAAEDGPRAVVAEEVRDFGRVAPGDLVDHDFLIANQGSAPLTIGGVRASRGARVEHYDAVIGPGETGRVRVKVDTWSFGGSPRLSVSFATNDPTRPKITVDMKVEVRPYVLARPGHARYLTYDGGPEGTIAQTLWEEKGADFRVIGVESPYPHLRVTYREVQPEQRDAALPSRQWRVEATIASESPVGPIVDFIRIRLDHPKQKEIRIPVSGFVRPMLAVTPPAASLGDVDSAKAPAWVLMVNNYGDADVNLTEATTDVPGFLAEVQPLEPGRRFRLRLTVGPEARPGAFAGTIRIRTSSPKRPFVAVPLTGRIVTQPPAAPAAAPRGGG